MSCEHKHIEHGYGFLSSCGFKGLGVYHICEDCNKVVGWDDDNSCNRPEEIEHNNKRKIELGIDDENVLSNSDT